MRASSSSSSSSPPLSSRVVKKIGTATIAMRDTDLQSLPTTRVAEKPSDCFKNITFPDLHGNPLRLIEELYYQGVLEISATAYAKLYEICYSTNTFLTTTQKAVVDEIVKEIKINPTRLSSLRFIGDEVGDRGPNDYITLMLLDTLRAQGVRYELIFSNHGAEFINYMAYLSDFVERKQAAEIIMQTQKDLEGGKINREEAKKKIDEANVRLAKPIHEYKPYVNPNKSVIALSKSIAKGTITPEEAVNLFEKSYWPFAKLSSYNMNNPLDEKLELSEVPEMTVFTHAPVALKTLKKIAVQFAVTPNDPKNVEEVKTMIDNLNIKFSKNVANTMRFFDTQKRPLTRQISLDVPFFRLVWNRELDKSDRNPKNLLFIFGHTAPEKKDVKTEPGAFFSTHRRHLGIDVSKVGKSETEQKGETCIACFFEYPKPHLRLMNYLTSFLTQKEDKEEMKNPAALSKMVKQLIHFLRKDSVPLQTFSAEEIKELGRYPVLLSELEVFKHSSPEYPIPDTVFPFAEMQRLLGPTFFKDKSISSESPPPPTPLPDLTYSGSGSGSGGNAILVKRK